MDIKDVKMTDLWDVFIVHQSHNIISVKIELKNINDIWEFFGIHNPLLTYTSVLNINRCRQGCKKGKKCQDFVFCFDETYVDDYYTRAIIAAMVDDKLDFTAHDPITRAVSLLRSLDSNWT